MTSKAALWILAALLAVAMLSPLPARAQVSIDVGITIGEPPPPIPVYVQPPVPAPGYIWTPGYWAWGPGGYYWVPGTWVPAPDAGLLWTPGYWAWNGDGYVWSPGYWAQGVGYYGGIDYGCGYYGAGYDGGRWFGDVFLYNTAVTRVGPNITNVYVDRTVYVYRGPPHVSYVGGHGGLQTRATPEQLAVAHGRHWAMPAAQAQHIRIAEQNRGFLASVNHGHPGVAAVPQPLSEFRHPPNFHSLTPSDRGAAQAHVVHAAPQHQTTGQHAAPHVQAAPQAQHGYAPSQHVPAPQYHAAPVQHQPAPQYHAAPVQHQPAPQYHAAPAVQHQPQPQYHAPPAQHQPAPQQHQQVPARQPERTAPQSGGDHRDAPDHGR